ncbi:MAG: NnrU family protein [Abyssibacter sp.]|uniref:methyltransferase family protein n=1 Tax=Abyssibacter sp. TaxID=2320200 RepID=UPI00321A8C8B
MSRIAVVGYGLACYAIFIVAVAYLMGFATGWLVPKSVNDGLSRPWAMALAVDLLLIALFAVQHTIMVQPRFKRFMHRLLPAACERATFVLASSLVLILIFLLWSPLPGTLWSIEQPWLRRLMWAGCAFGWCLALISTFQFDHFSLFGLRQVWGHLRGRPASDDSPFMVPWLYQWVRHPMMTGFLIAFWVMPDMSTSQAVLAAGFTVYIGLGTQHEERGLYREFGDSYRAYAARTPRFFPRILR